MKKLKISYKLFFLSVVLFVVAVLPGCSSWLELKPEDSLTQDEYWQTKEDVEAVIMSAYQKMSYLDAQIFQFGEIRGGMLMETSKSSNDQKEVLGHVLNQEQNLFKWEGFYKVINNANYVLEFASDVVTRDPTYTELLLEANVAEALFLRSLAYFYLVRGFRDVPLVLISSKSDDQNFFVEKSTEEEVLDKIVSDLKLAENTVISSYGDLANNKARATKSAVHALLADVYLWEENYDSCVYYCDQILQEERFSLMPSLRWFDLFGEGLSQESIFELYFNESQPNSLGDILAPESSGEYEFKLSLAALNKLDYTKEVIRGYGSYNPFRSDDVVWKYIGQQSTSSSTSVRTDLYSSNLVIYRLADIMLMKAEALVELNQLEEALALVNDIRIRARVSVITGVDGKDLLRDIVLEERAVELAFEGKRWWDLLRMGRRNNYERMNDFIKIITTNMSVIDRIVVENRLKNKDSWFFPIYISELRSNYNLVQNPFYETEF